MSDNTSLHFDSLPRWLSIGQVAFALDLTPQRVTTLLKQKVLPHEKLGRQILIPTEAVRRFVAIKPLRRAA